MHSKIFCQEKVAPVSQLVSQSDVSPICCKNDSSPKCLCVCVSVASGDICQWHFDDGRKNRAGDKGRGEDLFNLLASMMMDALDGGRNSQSPK